MLISARTVPLGMINGAVLRNAFGGGIAIGRFDSNGVADGGFTVTFDTGPPQSCVVLATKDYGRAQRLHLRLSDRRRPADGADGERSLRASIA
jgi:hypothetical protein